MKDTFSTKLTKFVDKSTVKLTTGFGHVINKSVRGMLLLLPVPLNRRQVVEIQVLSEARKTPSTKLAEVCWARPILVSDRVTMYLAGTRFFFELPAPRQLPQVEVNQLLRSARNIPVAQLWQNDRVGSP